MLLFFYSFQEETEKKEDGYPIYKRPNNEKTLDIERTVNNERKIIKIDNRWISTYCAILLIYLHCHINVEVVGFIKAVKYLFKYIFKGHDAALLEFGENMGPLVYNEVKTFVEGRYVCIN